MGGIKSQCIYRWYIITSDQPLASVEKKTSQRCEYFMIKTGHIRTRTGIHEKTKKETGNKTAMASKKEKSGIEQ